MTAWLEVLAKMSWALFSCSTLPYLFFPFVLISFSPLLYEMLTSSSFLNFPHIDLLINIYSTSTLLLLSCWFPDSVVRYYLHTSSSMPLAYPPAHPDSLLLLSPFIALSSSSSLRGTAELFIKQTSGICQSPGQSQSDWFLAHLRLS